MSRALAGVHNIADLREIAMRRLPKGLFEFIDRGNDDEIAVAENRAALDRIRLKPRVLVDVSTRSQEITLFGRKQAMPIIVGPTGSAGLTWFHGEVELARAAAKAGIPFTLATAALSPMETIAAQGGRPWFQLYMWDERKLSHDLVIRAREAGFEALVVTVDTPVNPGREYNLRNGFSFPFRFTRQNVLDVLCHPRWIATVLAKYVFTTGMPARALQIFREEIDRTLALLGCRSVEELGPEHLVMPQSQVESF